MAILSNRSKKNKLNTLEGNGAYAVISSLYLSDNATIINYNNKVLLVKRTTT